MERIEMERNLFGMVKALTEFAKLYDPRINYISMYMIDGAIDLRASHETDGEEDTVILGLHQFDDGSIRLNNCFYSSDEIIKLHKISKREESA